MRRALLIVVPGGIIVVLAAGVFLLLREAPSRVLTLPDGIQVQILGAAVGSTSFTTEKPWHKQARKLLPTRLQRWIPSPTSGACSSGTNSVTVYVRLHDPTGAAISGQPWDNYTTVDDVGFVYQREGGSCTMGGGTAIQMHGLILRSYPRRQSRFKLQLLDAKGAVIGNLDVANPVRGPFPEWQPGALPQTQSNGPVTLTLEGLHEGGRPEYRYIRPKWQLASSDPAWSKARVRSATFLDPTGNEGQWLSPREKAWKMFALVCRERLQDFAPTEFLALTNVTVPETGQCIQFEQPEDRNGVSLTVHAIAGAGTIANTNGAGWRMLTNAPGPVGQSTSSDGKLTIEKWSSRTPFILLEARNVQDHDDIEFKLRDDRGREIKMEGSQGYNGSANGRRMYLRGFTPLVDARWLNLEVIVNRPLQFEYMVNPADVQAAKK